MKKIISGFIMGFLLATSLAIPAIMFAMDDKYSLGRNHGSLDCQVEVVTFLGKYFESERPPKAYMDLLQLKAGAIVITDDSGEIKLHLVKH